MPEKLQKEIEQGEEKRESKVGEIVRNAILWLFILGLSAFAIILFAR